MDLDIFPMNESGMNVVPYDRNANAHDVAASRHRVLRNTYWLLSLSMVPTVLGAWLGIVLRLQMPFSPGFNMMAYLVLAFGLVLAIERYKNSGVGVVLLLGFTFLMGLMLSRVIEFYLKTPNGPQLIALAAGGTALVFLGLASFAATTHKDFSSWGKFLLVGLVMLVIASVANVFMQLPALQMTITVIGFGLFTALLLFDLRRVIEGGETNYVSATLAIYLDLYNMFVSLLQIVGAGSDE